MRREEEDRQILSNIEDQIPERYIDFFPKAREIRRKVILHSGPTNSGKTYQAAERLKQAECGIYLAPLRLLAYEQYQNMVQSGVPCSLVTGEERILDEFACVQASTIEMLNPEKHYDIAVIDEAQMIADRERGGAWTTAILGVCADEVHVICAPYAEELMVKLIRSCGDDCEIVHHERRTKLVAETGPFTFPRSVRKHDALIVFSKKSVLAVASELQQKNFKVSVIYGSLPYDVRQAEADRFTRGETDVVVATDAIGMGLNLPIERIVFLEIEKFDGVEIRDLKPSEVQQIAGRAGRSGIYETGYYRSEYGNKIIRKKYNTEVQPLTFAPLAFPQFLLQIEAPLSRIYEQWQQVEVSDGFVKADTSHEQKLCRMLESSIDDRELIYRLITIPFDDENQELLRIWSEIAKAEHLGKRIYFRKYYPDVDLVPITADSIQELESAYRQCDLLYNFMSRFEHEAYIDELLELKKKISDMLSEILKKQKLNGKTCRMCGAPLAWNYPYGVCQNCYRKRYGDYDRYDERSL